MNKSKRDSSRKFLPGATLIDGTAVSYQIESDGATWSAVVIAETNRELESYDLEFLLLDKSHRKLEFEVDIGEYEPLNFSVRNGTTAYFKLLGFRVGPEEPYYAYIRLLGTKKILHLLPEDEALPVTSDDEDDGGTTVPVANKKCCVTTFTTPKGTLKSTVRLDIPDDYAFLMPEGWKVNAVFKSDANCGCDLCQYKQEIKGVTRARRPGQNWQPITAPLDYRVVLNEKTGRTFLVPVFIGKTFSEDGKGVQAAPGRPTNQYGHRPSKIPLSESYSANGCEYWCVDTPVANIKKGKGIEYEIDVTFRGSIVDTTTKKTVQERLWKWAQKGTVK